MPVSDDYRCLCNTYIIIFLLHGWSLEVPISVWVCHTVHETPPTPQKGDSFKGCGLSMGFCYTITKKNVWDVILSSLEIKIQTNFILSKIIRLCWDFFVSLLEVRVLTNFHSFIVSYSHWSLLITLFFSIIQCWRECRTWPPTLGFPIFGFLFHSNA